MSKVISFMGKKMTRLDFVKNLITVFIHNKRSLSDGGSAHTQYSVLVVDDNAYFVKRKREIKNLLFLFTCPYALVCALACVVIRIHRVA